MKSLGNIFVLSIVLLLVVACKDGSYPRQLVVADSLSSVNADSAITMLKSMAGAMNKASERDLMYYKLICVKADNYAYRKQPSDSVVRELVDYYESKGDNSLLPEAYYYAGKTYRDLHDTPQAMDYFQKAIATNPDALTKINGQAYSQLGYMFSYQWMDKEALEMFKKSYVCNKHISDTTAIIFNLRDIAVRYKEMKQTDSARHYLDVALAFAEKQHNLDMAATVSGQTAELYYSLGKYKLARKYLQTALNYNDPNDMSGVLSIAADVYKALGYVDSAFYCYQKLAKIGTIYAKETAYLGLANYYVDRKNEQKALLYFKQHDIYADSVHIQSAAEAVQQKYSFFEYKLREKENYQLRIENKEHVIIIIILASVCAIAILVAFILFLYIKQRERIQKYMSDKYGQTPKAIPEKIEQVKTENNDIKSTEIYKLIRRMLNDPNAKKRLEDKEWKLLATEINKSYPGFTEKLNDLCRMSSFDQRNCMLLKIKLTPSDIGKFTNLSRSGIVSFRSKLYKRAFGKHGGAGDWDDVIDSL